MFVKGFVWCLLLSVLLTPLHATEPSTQAPSDLDSKPNTEVDEVPQPTTATNKPKIAKVAMTEPGTSSKREDDASTTKSTVNNLEQVKAEQAEQIVNTKEDLLKAAEATTTVAAAAATTTATSTTTPEPTTSEATTTTSEPTLAKPNLLNEELGDDGKAGIPPTSNAEGIQEGVKKSNVGASLDAKTSRVALTKGSRPSGSSNRRTPQFLTLFTGVLISFVVKA